MTPIGRNFIHFSLMPAEWPVTHTHTRNITCCFRLHYPHAHVHVSWLHHLSFSM